MAQPAIKRESAVSISGHFLRALASAAHVREPYDYWLLDAALPEAVMDAVTRLPFAPPGGAVFDGRRESNNSTRVYFDAKNQQEFPVCRDIAMGFSDPLVIRALEKKTGARLADGFLRVEYCQDTDGFWLEPHLDISVKLFTMLIYLSDDPDLFDAGTDVYDASPEHKLVASVPYERGRGMIFIPSEKSWHGFSKRPIHGLRQSIIVNYVSADWKNKQELAYQ